MMGNRRNLVFRVSIVINIAVLLYAAMHLSGTTTNGVDWMPVAVDGQEPARGSELRYLYERRAETRNETDPLLKSYDESTSQKTPSTVATTNKTASSIAFVVVPSEPEITGDGLDIVDENALSDATLQRLRSLLACNERDFLRETYQRGEFWVLKNYVRADHGVVLCHESVTYTTHAGFEFLDNVLPLVERWMAPVSLAIHAPGSDLAPTVNSIRYLRDCTGNDLVRSFVTFHVFFSHKHIPSKIPDPESFLNTPYNCSSNPPYVVKAESTYMKQKTLLYPVNVARNVARDSALTHFILPSDIELYPSPNLVPRFLNMIARNRKPLNTSTKPRVFPISIFEVNAKVKVSILALLSNPPYVVKAESTYMKQKTLLYPVNVARNVARDSALTHFILPSDIELYPSPNLVPRFLNMIARNRKPLNTSTKPRVFPISIFEVNAKVKVPSTKTELQAMLKNKNAIPFHKYVCPTCHNIPQAQQWMSANETNQMEVFHVGKRRGKFQIWEPIFIGTHHDPYYDERLSWEGKKDKMTQGYILCVKDYDFMILNNAFLIHKPGIKHFAKDAKRDAIVGRQNQFVRQVITPELKKLFGAKDGCAM